MVRARPRRAVQGRPRAARGAAPAAAVSPHGAHLAMSCSPCVRALCGRSRLRLQLSSRAQPRAGQVSWTRKASECQACGPHLCTNSHQVAVPHWASQPRTSHPLALERGSLSLGLEALRPLPGRHLLPGRRLVRSTFQEPPGTMWLRGPGSDSQLTGRPGVQAGASDWPGLWPAPPPRAAWPVCELWALSDAFWAPRQTSPTCPSNSVRMGRGGTCRPTVLLQDAMSAPRGPGTAAVSSKEQNGAGLMGR